MFRDVKDKVALLSKAAQATADNGYVLFADTPGNQEYIKRQFDDREVWMLVAAKKDARFSGEYPVPSKVFKYIRAARQAGLRPTAEFKRWASKRSE